MREAVFSTYQTSKICNVHHTTVINWINTGKLKAYTTPGGHRRVKPEDLREFMIRYNLPLPGEMKNRTKRVLIVDDDREFLEEMEYALNGQRIRLDFAYSGFQAGRKIYREKPDLILLDFKMPLLDGFKVCEILHKDKKTSKIPIIAVTALTSEEDRRTIKACGVKYYMPKPIDVDKLLKLIKEILHIE